MSGTDILGVLERIALAAGIGYILGYVVGYIGGYLVDVAQTKPDTAWSRWWYKKG